MRFHLDTSQGLLYVFPIEATSEKPLDTIPLADGVLLPTLPTSRSLSYLISIFRTLIQLGDQGEPERLHFRCESEGERGLIIHYTG